MFLMKKAVEEIERNGLNKKQIKIALHNAIQDENIIQVQRYYTMLEELKEKTINLSEMIDYNASKN